MPVDRTDRSSMHSRSSGRSGPLQFKLTRPLIPVTVATLSERGSASSYTSGPSSTSSSSPIYPMPLYQPMTSDSTHFNPANFASSHLVNVGSVAFPNAPAQFANIPAPFPNTPAPFPNIPAPFPNNPAQFPNISAQFPNTPAPFLNIPAPFPNIPAPFPNTPAAFLNPPAPFPGIPAPFANFLPPHPINANSVAFPDIPAAFPDIPAAFQEAPDPVAQDQNGQPDYLGFDLDFFNIFNIAEDGPGPAEDGPGATEDSATGVVVSTEGMEIDDTESDQGEEDGQEAQGVAHLRDPRSLDTASASDKRAFFGRTIRAQMVSRPRFDHLPEFVRENDLFAKVQRQRNKSFNR
ncbi:hypothetical protein PILCRDRAFT_12538 [Piloderma croceum F 1598]|uniref:Uncharacterized protein n=1 Tax=Piloderma croceum (strain F 1598) TaxID=765440 RepID=A0A0C3FAT3_PILCF|nr:hypothetical protein PILCRDRAFT_12538 [Piloderma croceum F 1598]